MDNYEQNFDRSTKARCKIAIDLILNEVLTVLVSFEDLPSTIYIQSCQKGNDTHSIRGPSDPTSYANIKVF